MTREATFQTIFESHYEKVFRLCKGYFIGDEAMAKDMAQEVFIRAWQHLENFRNEAKISTWIYRIAVNTCLSEKRKAVYKREKKSETFIEPAATADANEKEEQLNQLYKCIEKLSPLDKMIIMLVLEETTYEEISEVTGIKEASLRVRIHRIKKSLTHCVHHD
ncbi:RNA polymerase sigma factor [Ascidiimonas sp. W6]|uniref:RNA polymerase sigma factor n=1 Tax=Ascidiimonas meishanensis TaxID=3128903 RepID=UPI0030EC06A9